jgi:hypothetical protein
MAALPLWMAEVPAYEVVDGTMQITAGDFALAMPINVFLVGCAKGKSAIVQWERERHRGAEIVPFNRELAERHS